MGVNFEKLRQEQTKLAQQKGGANFWTPKDGRNTVRILPPREGEDTFWKETKSHFQVGDGKEMFYCYEMFDESCPICTVVNFLKKSGVKDDEALASAMKPTTRYYIPIIDRDDEGEEEEVKVMSCGSMIFKEIVALMCDPDWGDITDFEDGYDIVIKRTGTGRNTVYSVTPKKNPSIASESKTPEELEESLPDLDSIVIKKDLADILTALDDFADILEDFEDKPAKKKASSAVEAPKQKSKAKANKAKDEDDEDDPEDADEDDEDDDEDEDDIHADIKNALAKNKGKRK